MQNVSKSRIGCYPVLTLLWLGVIWGHSLQPAAVSSQESGAVLSGLSALLEALCLPPFLTETLVRKGAHMAEYLVLAALLTGSLRNRDRTGRGLCAGVLSASLFCALIDETIQLFVPGRSGQVTDIWIDFSGVMTDCDEGCLEWVDKAAVQDLPIWQGDKIFFKLLAEDAPFFHLELTYDGDVLVKAVLDGVSML